MKRILTTNKDRDSDGKVNLWCHNLTMDEELPNGFPIAECKVSNHKVKLHLNNNKAL